MLEVEVAVAKVGKYATSESGDTFEMVERPRGGLSFVLADGQRSGQSAKFISNLVARKAISLLGEGVRDEAAAHAAHDYLYAYRGGKVSSTLNIVSILSQQRVVRLARNNPVPVFVARPAGVEALDEPSRPVGFYDQTEPVMVDLDIEGDQVIVVATDGLTTAGLRSGQRFDVRAALEGLWDSGRPVAGALADALLERALEMDDGRPGDDISVLVISVQPRVDDRDKARRLRVRLPLRS